LLRECLHARLCKKEQTGISPIRDQIKFNTLIILTNLNCVDVIIF